MMCDVMPTISEDSISQRSSQFSGEDANFEQLMVSMLDERDKLMDSLREAQERLSESEQKLHDIEKERDSLQRQINANLPQVNLNYFLISANQEFPLCFFLYSPSYPYHNLCAIKEFATLTKELTQARETLLERDEEIGELKAERNNTRVLILVNHHLRLGWNVRIVYRKTNFD